MATPVQRATAIIGALRNEENPPTALLLEIGETVARARDLDPAAMTNAQKALLFLEVVNEGLRAVLNRGRLPAAEAAARTTTTAQTNADLPGVTP